MNSARGNTLSRVVSIASANQIHFLRYRIRVIEQWPESDYKKASLGAARAVLAGDIVLEQLHTEEDQTVIKVPATMVPKTI